MLFTAQVGEDVLEQWVLLGHHGENPVRRRDTPDVPFGRRVIDPACGDGVTFGSSVTVMDGSGEVTLRPGVVFPTPAPDAARSWMTAVHEVARLSGSRIAGELESPCVGRSYYRVSLT